MFPLNPDLLIFVKFFIFITCVIFWVKLAYDALNKSMRLRSHRYRFDADEHEHHPRAGA